ncbi:methylated-DNA--[protein]-cysteine S-methyltransferase [Herbiconiux moechotypicola]|uniref:Methylated-DNA--[protein]-cysteine S-methyltransferase n=1 Tax=Herbiconiux moechotypicola TaxID=637393 RepID=A0ABN3D8A3_9MICO|nr:methylated-DNA--[protein]-cysteine S-methyltransferase [Herbiconiux moechotypicola]MCS5728275.1 methylated-DNA--[protein]-cysteine S-methyltransferase [Herbiconiux moechotypicola]
MTTPVPGAARVQFIDTSDGAFGIIADADDRVLASGWTDDPAALLARLAPGIRPASLEPGRTRAAEAALAYYDGDVTAIDGVEVRQSGGEFHTLGWAALRTIEPGHPLSYQEFAALLGRPTAVRAAASACARNAPALFVPCHRVLRTDGTLGGFAWGTDVKRSLLARESAAR